MKRFSLVLFFLICSCGLPEERLFFTPSLDCENNIIQYINQSQHSIDVAIYALNNDNIVAALKRAHDRGVKIRILTDRLQASSKYSKVRELHDYGINIKVHSKHKIEHNKFAVFDGQAACNGSYNWTNAASKFNSENCAFYSLGHNFVPTFQQRFAILWKLNSDQKSEVWFNKISSIMQK